MNKKLIGIIAGVIVVLVIGMGILKQKGVEPVTGIKAVIKPSIDVASPATYLPDSTIMYYSMSDLTGIWSDVKKSNFWDKFSGLRLWADLGVKENFNQLLSTLEAQLGMEVTESRFLDVFGRQVVIGITVGDKDKAPRVIVQSFVGKATQFVEGLLKSVPETTDSVETIEYKGEKISIVNTAKDEESAPVNISYVLVNNIFTLVFGTGNEEIKNIVDYIKGDNEKSLLTTSKYSNFEAKYLNKGAGTTIYYVDIEKIAGDLEDILKPVIEAAPEQFAGVNIGDITKSFKAIDRAGGVVLRTADGLMLKSYVVPNPEFSDKEEKTGETLDTIKMVPAGSLITNITTNIGNNLKKTWGNFLKEAPAQQTPANKMNDVLLAIKNMESSVGLNIQKDIIDQLKSEMLFVFDGLNLEGMFPVPRLAVVFEVADGAKSLEKFGGIISETLKGEELPVPLSLSDKKIQGANFKTLVTPLGEGLSPVIGHLDNWLIIATNSFAAEKLLNVNAGKETSIAESESFKGYISSSQSYTNCNMTNIRSLNQQIRTLLSWLLQRKDALPMPNIESITANINTYALPILEQLEVFKAVVFKSFKENDMSVQEGNIIFEDLKK